MDNTIIVSAGDEEAPGLSWIAPYAAMTMAEAEDAVRDMLSGNAFGAVLPELRANKAAIHARMPRVVKNSCGYRVEAILGDSDISGAAAPSHTALRGTAQGSVEPGLAHLQKLFVGAEGTLGIVTEATLNLVPLPATRGIAMAYFPSVFAVGEAVPGILALLPTAVEIMAGG